MSREVDAPPPPVGAFTLLSLLLAGLVPHVIDWIEWGWHPRQLLRQSLLAAAWGVAWFGWRDWMRCIEPGLRDGVNGIGWLVFLNLFSLEARRVFPGFMLPLLLVLLGVVCIACWSVLVNGFRSLRRRGLQMLVILSLLSALTFGFYGNRNLSDSLLVWRNEPRLLELIEQRRWHRPAHNEIPRFLVSWGECVISDATFLIRDPECRYRPFLGRRYPRKVFGPWYLIRI